MSVSNLTGTTWGFNLELAIPNNMSYNINFTSFGNNYTNIHHSKDYYNNDCLNYDNTQVYDSEEDDPDVGPFWTDDRYKIISITGGADVTNATLIAWLEANATQQIPVDPAIYINGSKVVNAYVGNTPVNKIYVGQNLVWERVESNFLTSDGKILETSDGDVFAVQGGTTSYNITINCGNTRGYDISVYSTDTPDDWFSPSDLIGTITASTTATSYNFVVTKQYLWFYVGEEYAYASWHDTGVTNATKLHEDYDENDYPYLEYQITGNNAVIEISPET